MAVPYKIVIDCTDPHRLADFWAVALDYLVEDHAAFVQALLDSGQLPESGTTRIHGGLAFADAAAIRDPDHPVDPRSGVGRGGRVLFQKVPEGNSAEPTTGPAVPARAKNKLHLDLHYGPERRAEVVDRLVAAGATKLWDGEQGGSTWVTLADPEGNEFCVA